MQLTQLTAVLLAAVKLASAQNEAQVLSVIIGDIRSHNSDYLSYIQAGHAPPSGVLQVYQQISTYTDDSYTSLFTQIDQSAVSTFITGVPWYSSRIEPALAAAETGGAGGAGGSGSEGGSGGAGGSGGSATSESGSASESSASESKTSASESESSGMSGSSGMPGSSGMSESHSSSHSGSESHSGSHSGSESHSGSGSGSHSGSGSQTSSTSTGGAPALGAYAIGESGSVMYLVAPFLLALGTPLLL